MANLQVYLGEDRAYGVGHSVDMFFQSGNRDEVSDSVQPRSGSTSTRYPEESGLWSPIILRVSSIARLKLEQLSRRELEVLQAVASGDTNKAIAGTLEISVKTVEKHRSSLMRKLRVRSVPELMRVWFQAHPEQLIDELSA